MLDSIKARHELLTLIGQPVHVQATLTRLGSLPGRDDRKQYVTALLENVFLDGVPAPFNHVWIRLGETGSRRAKEHRLSGCPVEMDAIVIAYKGGRHVGELRLGLGEVSNVIAYTRGRWRTIARNREAVNTERGEQYTQFQIDQMLQALLHRSQSEVMKEVGAYANAYKVDRATQAALERYYIRKEPVTPGEMGHIVKILRR